MHSMGWSIAIIRLTLPLNVYSIGFIGLSAFHASE